MSTRYIEVYDERDKSITLSFETSISGNKFMIENTKTGKCYKFWFTKANWKSLRDVVDDVLGVN